MKSDTCAVFELGEKEKATMKNRRKKKLVSKTINFKKLVLLLSSGMSKPSTLIRENKIFKTQISNM